MPGILGMSVIHRVKIHKTLPLSLPFPDRSGKLMGPKGVSVDRNGHIIVVDNKACCVFIFQPNGKIVTRFGSRGNGDRQFAGTLDGNM